MRALPDGDSCRLCASYPLDKLDPEILAEMLDRSGSGMLSAYTAAQLAQRIRDEAVREAGR